MPTTLEMVAAVRNGKKGNDFAQSLCDGFAKYGRLSEKQLYWVTKLYAELTEPAEPVIEDTSLKAIYDLLDNVRKNADMRQPKVFLAVEGEKVKAGFPRNGRDVVYVTDHDDFLGTIMPDGSFRPGRDLRFFEPGVGALKDALKAYADNPEATAIAFGHAFGICSCCGRTLTNPESIALGIGPVCRTNFFS